MGWEVPQYATGIGVLALVLLGQRCFDLNHEITNYDFLFYYCILLSIIQCYYGYQIRNLLYYLIFLIKLYFCYSRRKFQTFCIQHLCVYFHNISSAFCLYFITFL